MTLEDRIARLEYTLGTLINWITLSALSKSQAEQMLKILESEYKFKSKL